MERRFKAGDAVRDRVTRRPMTVERVAAAPDHGYHCLWYDGPKQFTRPYRDDELDPYGDA